jgi:tRNA(Ile)-lysidine synthase
MKPSPPTTSLVAVSGGRDSVVLLHWLLRNTSEKLVVCHLNHGLRGRESGQDAAFVRRLAAGLGLVCEAGREDVAAIALRESISVETAGRQLRHRFLAEAALKHGARRIYLAHHADDQAETILANLCRGAGLNGLGGMRETSLLQHGAHSFELRRPLLNWRRSDIEAYLREHGLKFREDSSNTSRGPRRNRLRLDVLPLLGRVFDRDVVPQIVRLGRRAERDEEALGGLALERLKDCLDPDHALRFKPLAQDPEAIVSRLLRHWLVKVLDLPGIGHGEVELVLAMLHPGGPAKINLPGGHHLRRKAGRLWLERQALRP